MIRRQFVIACCVLLSATSMFAQSTDAKAKADPISGTWKGELVPQNASSGVPVTMELKLDGKNAVTGNVLGFPNPAEVKTSTFESEDRGPEAPVGQER